MSSFSFYLFFIYNSNSLYMLINHNFKWITIEFILNLIYHYLSFIFDDQLILPFKLILFFAIIPIPNLI